MNKVVSCRVDLDDFTKRVSDAFDYNFNGITLFEIPQFIKIPERNEFNIGLIVGNSGTGKTLLLNEFGKMENIEWNRNKAIVSHFENPDIALERMFAVGLSSIPTLCKPYHVLSTGEAFRADISRRLENNAVIDEFTSVVNRETAYSISVAISKYIRKKDLRGIVFASCHFDIIEWLEPDWIFNTNVSKFDINNFSVSKFPELGRFEIV